MAHVFMGVIVLTIAICMVLGAIMTAPKLVRLGIRHSARYSFATVAILTGMYLGWISTLFFADKLGPSNYVPELWGLRILLMLACFHYLWSIWRCDK